MPEDASLPTTERLLELVDAIADQPVTVVADLVVDRFITGTPKRVSREAPVLILRQDGDERRPGGGANAIANVTALGGRTRSVGSVGDDENGEWLRDHFTGAGLSAEWITTRAGAPTPTKTRILGGAPGTVKQQIVRYDVEPSGPLPDPDFERVAAAATRACEGARAVLLSDYGYGAVTPALARRVADARPEGVPILCDSRFRLAEYRGVDGATPNLEEVAMLAGRPVEDDDDALSAIGRGLLSTIGLRFLLITRGGSGMTLCTATGAWHIPVHGTDQVADVTGAGDTVIGTLALGLAAGASSLEASLLANYAGGIVVMKAGTATLTPRELVAAIRSDARPLEGATWASY